jgi:signal transduction histidine kinase
LQVKLILPYVLLTILIAGAGMFIITRLVAGAARERFTLQVQSVSRSATETVVRVERAQIDALRLLAFTGGLPAAVADFDAQSARDLIEPVALNARVAVVTVVDSDGVELVSLSLDPAGTSFAASGGADLSRFPIVSRVLAGEADALGDKFADLLTLGTGRFIFTSAPLIDDTGEIVGALMVGTPLQAAVEEVRVQSRADVAVLLDVQGAVITSEGAELALDPTVAAQIMTGQLPSLARVATVNGQPMWMLYVPLRVRERTVGVLGTGLSGASLEQDETDTRNGLIAIFGLGTLAVIALGYVLARGIVRPVRQLQAMARAVAAGDLQQQLTLDQQDEIGELAEAFTDMTARLRKRTAEADRLYGEMASRAAELEDLNAQLRTAQKQLIQSEKLASVGQLTAGIVHDVKNPLAVIKGIAELVQEDEAGLSPFAREQLSLIRENATRANAIVSKLLTFARQTAPDLKRRDLREPLGTAVRLTEFNANKAGVRVTVRVPDEPVPVVFDPQQIEQVIINLIQNALQAMPQGGRLDLILEANGDWSALTVRDTGLGIAPEHLSRVFDPFFTTRAAADGTGLGLSVTYGIVAEHGGDIRVESELGEGAVFHVRLPTADKRES